MGQEQKKEQVQIALLGDGPMVVQGNFVLLDGDRPIELSEAERQTGVTLCRCGRSRSLPYCDGSHVKHT